MAILLQLRRGTDTDNSVFIGGEGEVSVDLVRKSLRVHTGDGTLGGYELARVNLSNVLIGKTLTPAIDGVHDVGTPVLRFDSAYLKSSLNLDNISLIPISSGIRLTNQSGYFDITQGDLGNNSIKVGAITLGNTTISEYEQLGLVVSKGEDQFIISQSLTETSSPTFDSITINNQITLGTSILKTTDDGISIQLEDKVLELNQSLKTTDDVVFNSITANNLLANADSASKLKTPFDIKSIGDVLFDINGIDGSENKITTSTLKSITTGGVYGDQSRIPIITINDRGLVTNVETQPVVAIASDFLITESVEDRDRLEEQILKIGMLVLTKDTNFLWQLMDLIPDFSNGTYIEVPWSESLKSHEITLSFNNLVAKNFSSENPETIPEGYVYALNPEGYVYASKGFNSGKYYFEIKNQVNDDDNGFIGLATISGDISLLLQFNNSENVYKLNGDEFISSVLNKANAGDIIRIAVDFDLGKIWFGINDIWEFQPGSQEASLEFAPNAMLYPLTRIIGTTQEIYLKPSLSKFDFSMPEEFLPWSQDLPINPPIRIWERFYVSPTRKKIQLRTPSIGPLSFYDFELNLGNCLIVYKLQVSEQCTFEVHETSERIDVNPYKFITPTLESPPFVDTGLTYLADGAILRGRRYYIWSSIQNGDGDNNIYCRIYNHTENDYIEGIEIEILCLPIEKSAIIY